MAKNSIRNGKRALLVADISNLYYTVHEKYSGKINYHKMITELDSLLGVDFIRMIAYGSDINDQAVAFKGALSKLGFELKYKTPKQFPDGTMKADWDVGIAIDVIEIMDSVDMIVLCCADGDFAPLVKHVQSRGKLIVIAGCGISHELQGANSQIEIPKDWLV